MKDLSQHENLLDFAINLLSNLDNRMTAWQLQGYYSPVECYSDMAWLIGYMVNANVPFFAGDNKDTWSTVQRMLLDRGEHYANDASLRAPFKLERVEGGVAKLNELTGDIVSFFGFAKYLADQVAIEHWDRNLKTDGTRGINVAEGLKIMFRIIDRFHKTYWPHDPYFQQDLPNNKWINAVRTDLKNAYTSMGEVTMSGTFDTDGDIEDLPFSWAGQ